MLWGEGIFINNYPVKPIVSIRGESRIQFLVFYIKLVFYINDSHKLKYFTVHGISNSMKCPSQYPKGEKENPLDQMNISIVDPFTKEDDSVYIIFGPT